jgi:pimeloyl-ACP methyl ester carboxylesterase
MGDAAAGRLTHVTTWGGPPEATPAVLVHGTFSWGTLTFSGQRPLAASRRLLVPDRRGFGAGPGSYSDYAVDATDVISLLGEGDRAHLVGHSYGGTVAMLAAAARPDLVRSLTLIEPCAHQVAVDVPVVAQAIEDGRRFMESARRGTAEEYIAAAYGERPRPSPAAWLTRAAETALGERPCWLASLATAPILEAPFPKLVIAGGWEVVPPGYLPGMAGLMHAVCSRVAERIGARLVRVPGAAHEAQREQPGVVNSLLDSLWTAADRPASPR